MRDDRLDLLRRLTAASPRWALWRSGGDIDSFAPASEWPALVDAVAGWARETGREPVLTCRHIEGTLVIVAVEPGTPALLEQIDVIDYRLLHGTPVVRAAERMADATMGPDGYRSIAPWTEPEPSLGLELRTIAGALMYPAATARRVAAAPARRRCPILRALRDGRRVTGDLDAWLADVDRTHRGTVSPPGYR